MLYELRLYLDSFEPQAKPVVVPATKARALYVVDGSLAVRDDDAVGITLAPNAAMACAGPCTLSAGSLPGKVLRWELGDVGTPDALLAPDRGSSTCLQRATLELDGGQPYLLRCDRVDFPPGGVALTHTHQGGGIRCLLHGSIEIQTQGQTHGYGPLQAWFEAGPDPVYAAADKHRPSAFVRAMILPGALLGGKSSIRYVHAEDLNKPKSQRYQILVDTRLA